MARGRFGPALLLVWACLGLPIGAWALPPDTWLISVGNNRGTATEVQLHYAERDAERFAATLRRHGGLKGAQTRILTGESADAVRAALTAVEAGIQRGSAQAPSALVVYYSGHANASALHLGGTDLPLDELRTLVRNSSAKLKLLIVDACRSGAVTRVKGIRPANLFRVDLLDRVAAEGVAMITSSTAGESSQESDRLQGSFFSHHLLNALRGAADRNGDGQITLAEAYSYAYDQTVRSSGETLSVQHPTYAFDVKGRGDLVLTRVPVATTDGSARLRFGPVADYLVSEASGGVVVAEVHPRAANAVLALPPRRYAVQQRGAEEYREYTVELTPGATVALNDLPYRSVRYDRLVRQRGGTRTVVHGFRLLAGAHGEVLAGEGVAPTLSLGYGVDLPWLSLGLRVRGSLATADAEFDRQRQAVGVGLTIERFTDLRWASVAFGLLAEATWHRQTFDTDRDAADGSTVGGTFAGLLAVERALLGGLSLRLEGGPSTVIAPMTQVEDGAPTEDDLQATFTWWANAGVVWRL